MPALRIFGRRTLVGGDDLHLPCLLGIGLRGIQLLAFLLPVWLTIDDEARRYSHTVYMDYFLLDAQSICRNIHATFGWLLLIYASASTVMAVVQLLLEIRLYRASSVGSPTEMQPRSSLVAQVLEWKFYPLFLLQGIVLVLGIAVVSMAPRHLSCLTDDSDDDDDDDAFESTKAALGSGYNEWNLVGNRSSFGTLMAQVAQDAVKGDPLLLSSEVADDDYLDPSSATVSNLWWIAFSLLWISQFLEAIFLLMVIMRVSRRQRDRRAPVVQRTSSMTSLQHAPSSSDVAAHEELWTNRCISLCQCLGRSTCFIFGGKEVASGNFSDVARALTDYFETGGADVDIVASDVVIGLAILQKLQRLRKLEARRDVLMQKSNHSSRNNSSSSLSRMATTTAPTSASSAIMGQPQFQQQQQPQARRQQQPPLPPSYQPPTAPILGSNNNNNGNFDPLTPTLALQNDNSNHSSNGIPGTDSNHRFGGLTRATAAESSSFSRQRTSFYVMNVDGSNGPSYYDQEFRKVLSPSNPVDMQTLSEAARFGKYQLAIYTWALYLYMKPCTGIPKLLSKVATMSTTSCCCCHVMSKHHGHPSRQQTQHQHSHSSNNHGPAGARSNGNGTVNDRDALLGYNGPRVIGDNICSGHKAALLLIADLDDDADLVYVQLRSSFAEIPYCILVDHAWKTVVLAIRGTFSLEDCVTDIMVDPEPLEELGNDFGFDGRDQYVHGGVLNCARIVYQDLERHGILDQLLLGNQAKYPDYRLRVVGHSLGGATSTIISYMLRPKFTTLRCLNYSPPGASMSWRMATECQEWCTAYVLDSDLVPRLSLNSMDHLRDEVLDLIGRVKVPKIEVVSKATGTPTGLFTSCFKRGRQGDDEEEGSQLILQNTQEKLRHDLASMMHSQPIESDFQRGLRHFRAVQTERRSARGALRRDMFPPGKIVHYMKTGQQRTCLHGLAKCVTCCTTNLGAQYTPVWIQNSDLNEIVVSPTMGTDHFPNRIYWSLQKVADEYGADTTRLNNINDYQV